MGLRFRGICLPFAIASCFCFIASIGHSQTRISWELLADVEMTPKFFEELGSGYLVPTFGDGPLSFEGKEVMLTGYFIPFDESDDFYVLSQNTYSACFFCGAAGPETVVEIWFSDRAKKDFMLDDQLTIKGKLRLNSTDVNHMNYILEEAQAIKK